MNITLEKATVNDLDRLMPMVGLYHQFEHIDMSEQDRENAVKVLLQSSLHGGIWLIMVESHCIGYIALCKGYSIEFKGFDAFVDEFFIQEQYRGKGIGAEVLQRVKTEAKNLDIQALHLEVAKDNTPAKRLYQKSGFAARDRYVLMSVNLD